MAIVGGGFSGIYAAWRLAQDGAKVALLEGGEGLGGNLRSIHWNGYWIDFGVHNFDMRARHAESFFNTMLGDSVSLSNGFLFASALDRSWALGCEQPNFSADPDFCTRVIHELKLKQSSQMTDRIVGGSYQHYIQEKYGNILSTAMIPLIQKVVGHDLSRLDIAAKGSLKFLERPVLGSDSAMLHLKESSDYWNERIGISTLGMTLQMRDPQKTETVGYPVGKGMLTFCEKAQEKLAKNGVEIYLNATVNQLSTESEGALIGFDRGELMASKVFWSLPEIFLSKVLKIEDSFSKMNHVVGTCFFVFEVPSEAVCELDYLNDYAPQRSAFRYGNQGVYSQQIKANGNTFILAEVWSHPKDFSTKLTPQHADEVWGNILDVGFVNGISDYVSNYFFSAPVAFTVPSLGWIGAYKDYNAIVDTKFPNLLRIGSGFRGRNAFIEFYESDLRRRLLD